jgi:transcriptional regulator with XRE-family HTH domain
VKLKEYRALKGWSQTGLAKEAGVKQSTISAIEAGNNEGFSVKTMKQLADALEVTVLDIEEFAAKIRDEETADEDEYDEDLADLLDRIELNKGRPGIPHDQAVAEFERFYQELQQKRSKDIKATA